MEGRAETIKEALDDLGWKLVNKIGRSTYINNKHVDIFVNISYREGINTVHIAKMDDAGKGWAEVYFNGIVYTGEEVRYELRKVFEKI